MADVIELAVDQLMRSKREHLRTWQEAFEQAPGFTAEQYDPVMCGIRDYVQRCNSILGLAVDLQLSRDVVNSASVAEFQDALDQVTIIESGFERATADVTTGSIGFTHPFLTLRFYALTAEVELEELQLGLRIDSAAAKKQFLSGELMSAPESATDLYMVFALQVMYVMDALVRPNDPDCHGYLLRPHQVSDNFWTRWVCGEQVVEVKFNRTLLVERTNAWEARQTDDR